MTTFTLLHVVLSLIGIGSGLVVLYGMIRGKRMDSGTTLFLTTTAATSLTGFLFPFHGITPGIVVGIVSMVVLAVAATARYMRHLAGAWRAIYVITATTALYLNVFVLIVQLFRKVASLNALAPTQSEPPFVITQGVVMAIFVVAGIFAVKGFRQESPKTTAIFSKAA
jgi:hypothetical protein